MLITRSLSVAARVVKATRITPRVALKLTEAASQQIRKLMDLKPDVAGMRIGVKTRGCNGLTYTLEYAVEKHKFDEEISTNGGAKVFIDSKAQLTLLGSEMDYQEAPLCSQFVFINPNIKGTCGCGESFNM